MVVSRLPASLPAFCIRTYPGAPLFDLTISMPDSLGQLSKSLSATMPASASDTLEMKNIGHRLNKPELQLASNGRRQFFRKNHDHPSRLRIQNSVDRLGKCP